MDRRVDRGSSGRLPPSLRPGQCRGRGGTSSVGRRGLCERVFSMSSSMFRSGSRFDAVPFNMVPLGFKAGDDNFYRYAGNDPANVTDPSGLQGKKKELTLSMDDVVEPTKGLG